MSAIDVFNSDSDDDLSDPDVLAQFDGDGLTWMVYRGQQDGEEITERAGRSSRAYVAKINGRIDISRLASIVGPGTWKLFAKIGGKLVKTVTVTIEGQPWPPEAFNRTPARESAPPAPASSPGPWAPALPAPAPRLDEATTALLRNEIRAALAGFSPGFPPQAPAAPPTDPMLLLNVALQMAEKMNAGARPATDVSQLFGTFVEAYQTGMKQGARMNARDDDGGGGTLGKVMESLLPVLLGGVRPAAGPPMLRPPGAPPAPAGAPQLAPAPPAPAAAPQLAPWTARDHAIAALFKAARDGVEDVGTLATAVNFYLDKDQDFESFQAIGEAGLFSDEAVRAGLVAWVGAGSVMAETAKILADAPTVGEMVRRVQLGMLEPDEAVPEAAPEAPAV